MSSGPRYLWPVAAVVIATLAPGTACAAGYQVSRYAGLSPAQRASLLAIARDTWKFYGADIDQATSLPMDNITFAGGSATPTGVRPVHLRGQHRAVPVGRGLGPGPRPDQRAAGPR